MGKRTRGSSRHVVADLVGDVAFKNLKGKTTAHRQWDARADLESTRFGYNKDDKIRRLQQCHTLFIISSNAKSLSNIGHNLFGATYQLTRPGQVRPIVVGAPWAVCPRLVLVDKFHEVKNPETAIYCRLQDL